MLSLQTGLNNTKQDSNNSLVLYYNLYDKYDEKIIDNYYSYVAGGKFDYSGLFNERTSYGFGIINMNGETLKIEDRIPPQQKEIVTT